MKTSKKILSLLLSVIMLLSLVAPIALAADNYALEYEFEEAPEPYEDVLIVEGASADIDWDSLFDYMHECIKNHVTEIDISSYKVIKTDENFGTLKNFLYYYPANLKNINGFSYRNSSSGIKSIIPNYVYDAETFKTMVEACEDVVLTFTHDIKDDDTLEDYEKCLIIHDRLATWCEYDYATYLTGTDNIPDESYSAYGPLVLKIGVCEGYALAYKWMMDELGIESYYETSSTLGHGWNMVYCGGEAYYVDVTHDDPVWDRLGCVYHNYVLVSYSSYSANHSDASDFSTEPTSTLYEDAFWTSSDMSSAEIQYTNGKYYYIGSLDGKTGIISQDKTTGEETLIKEITDTWRYYYTKYSGLDLIGDKLIYNTTTQIRSYDITTGEDELILAPDLASYDDNTLIYGTTQKDGVIYYWLNTAPYYTQDVPGTFLTLDYCTEHDDRDVIKTVQTATCTVPGIIKYVCNDCGKVFTENYTVSHNYSVYAGVDAEATCQTNRWDIYKCANCTETIAIEIPGTMTEHTYTELVGTKTDATCTSNRIDTYKCATCTLTIDKEIENTKSEHNYNVFVGTKTDASCTSNRIDTYKCATCTATIDREIENTKSEHNYNVLVGVKSDATCTSNRFDTYKCATCTATIDKEIENTKLEHNYNVLVGVKSDATCSANRVDTYKCATCSLTTDKEVANTKTEHNYNVLVGVKSDATCSANRVDTYKCATCTLTIDKEIENTKTEHNYNVLVGTKSKATCTSNRVDTYKCATCTLTIDKEIENTKSEHNYNVLVGVKSEATCTSNRYDTYKCATCTATIDKEIENTKLEHDYSVFKSIERKATCQQNEVRIYGCKNCRSAISVEIPDTKIDHNYVGTVTAPTCTEQGYTQYECSMCHDKYRDDYVDALGHTDGDNDGVCDRCKVTIKEANCSCACHKTGIANFFFKIKIFFSKLFGIDKNRYCSCGAAHW